MHNECMRYVINVKALFNFYFTKCRVLEIGSQDINGSVRFLFSKCDYTGIDLGPGKGVDFVCPGYQWKGQYNTIITTEVAEHDEYWKLTFQNCIDMLKPAGILIFTCAGEGRPEHGTKRTSVMESPYTTDYYQNVTPEMIESLPGFKDHWMWYRFSVNKESHDTQFVGIKKKGNYDMRILKNNFIYNPRMSEVIVIINHLRWFYIKRINDFKNAFKRIFT